MSRAAIASFGLLFMLAGYAPAADRVDIMAQANQRTVLMESGWLALPDGRPYAPLGGFYANWPNRPTPPDQQRLLPHFDLFPHTPMRYAAGFPWDADTQRLVEQWLSLLHDNGVNSLRLMLRNMDLVGKVDQTQLRAVKHLFAMGQRYGICFDVALCDDYTKPPYVNRETLQRIVLPQYTAEELANLPPHRRRFLVERRMADNKYTDPDARLCQKDYLRELIPALANEPAVFCYEFENEMVNVPMEWVNDIAAFIRTLDPRTLILGNPGPHAHPEPLRWREAKIDLFSFHPYTDGAPDADHGAVMFCRTKWAAMAGKAMFTGEGGINQNRWQKEVSKVEPPAAVRGARDQVWLTIAAGCNGAYYWTPQVRGEIAEFGKAAAVLSQLDLKTFDRAPAPLAVVIPPTNKENAACQALAMEALARGVDFDFVLEDDKPIAGRQRLTLADARARIDSLPALARPSKGYHLAARRSGDGRQMLLYLRNVARVEDVGTGRPCWIRIVEAADAWLELPAAPSGRVRAYDLDEGRWIEAAVEGNRIALGRRSEHDYVVIVR